VNEEDSWEGSITYDGKSKLSIGLQTVAQIDYKVPSPHGLCNYSLGICFR